MALDSERERFWYNAGWPEIADLYAERQALEAEAEALDKYYESAMEQSEFRAQALREILELCKGSGTRRDLVKTIQTLVENSYVEL